MWESKDQFLESRFQVSISQGNEKKFTVVDENKKSFAGYGVPVAGGTEMSPCLGDAKLSMVAIMEYRTLWETLKWKRQMAGCGVGVIMCVCVRVCAYC